MPVTTTTIDLEAEAERLDERLDDLADEAASADTEQEREQAAIRGQEIEQHLVGVHWALHPGENEGRESYDEITLGALTAGEQAQAADRAQTAENQQVGHGDSVSVANASRIFFAAAGVVDAPFLDDSAGYEATVRVLRECNPQFVHWIEDRVDDLTTPDVDLGNGFAARLAEKRSDAEGS